MKFADIYQIKNANPSRVGILSVPAGTHSFINYHNFVQSKKTDYVILYL